MARDGNAKGMKETKFKDTVLEKIPEEWSVAQVGDLFSMKRNNTLSRDNLNYSDLAGYKNIHYGDVLVKFGAFIDISTDTLPFVNHDIKFNPDLLENGDVIIADTAEDETVGKASEVIGISAKDKVVSGLHTMILHPNEKFASKYLGYFLNGEAYHNSLYNSMQGTKVISISKKAINATSIAYPSLSEQQRIASALSDADALVAELDALIEKKRAIMAGTMQELLTGKRRLQGFDEPWVERILGQIGTFVAGNGFPLIHQGKSKGKYPFYKVSDMNNSGNQTYMIVANNHIDQEVANILNCNIIPANSIVFAKIGAAIFLERKRLTSIDCCIDNNMQSFQCNKSFDCQYALWLLRSIKIADSVSQTALPALKVTDLKKIEVYIPSSLAEQRAIASILSDMDAEIAELEAKRDKYKEVRQGMMQQLLTGKIRLI